MVFASGGGGPRVSQLQPCLVLCVSPLSQRLAEIFILRCLTLLQFEQDHLLCSDEENKV